MRLLKRLTTLACCCIATALATGAHAASLNLGAPKSVPAMHLAHNGDGNLVKWDITDAGYEFTLYSTDLTIIKQFTINVLVSAGTPTGVYVTGGSGDVQSFYLTQHLFNDDDNYEVLFSRGELYNEKGIYLGRLNGNWVYQPSEDHVYVGGSSVIEDVEESKVVVERYNAGIPEWLVEFNEVQDGSHADFGYPSLMLYSDMAGIDVVSTMNSYDHFSTVASYQQQLQVNGRFQHQAYVFFYKTIAHANSLIMELKGHESSTVKASVLAQAYAWRAWAYFNLAQYFQHTYYGNESKLCVPLVTEANANSLPAEGMARATVQEVYDFILADLDRAIALLDGNGSDYAALCEQSPKTLVSPAVALGLRARVNLVMHRYNQAADDALKAIELFEGRPYLPAEVKAGGMCDIADVSWMWGIDVKDTDRQVTTQIVNFPSMMSAFCYGYMSVGSWRYGNHALVDAIPQSDVRRRHFVDGFGNHLVDNDVLVEKMNQYRTCVPYNTVKFGYTSDANLSHSAETPDADIPLMRVEEMYYIVAEARAMMGDTAGARSYLLSFVNNHRDTMFTVDAGVSPNELRDIIWNQRRMEFWGEGIAFFDLLRLGKGVDRRGSGYYETYNFVIEPTSPLLALPMPTVVPAGVPRVLADQQNPIGTQPLPYWEPDTSYTEMITVIGGNDLHTTRIAGTLDVHRTYDAATGGYIMALSSNLGEVNLLFDRVNSTMTMPVQQLTSSIDSINGLYVADANAFRELSGIGAPDTTAWANETSAHIPMVLFAPTSDGYDVRGTYHITYGLMPSSIGVYGDDNYTSNSFLIETEGETVRKSFRSYIGGSGTGRLYIAGPDNELTDAQILHGLRTGSLEYTVLQPVDSITYTYSPGDYTIHVLSMAHLGYAADYAKYTVKVINTGIDGRWGEWSDVLGQAHIAYTTLVQGTAYYDVRVRESLDNAAVKDVEFFTESNGSVLANYGDTHVLHFIVDTETGVVTIPKQMFLNSQGNRWTVEDPYVLTGNEKYLSTYDDEAATMHLRFYYRDAADTQAGVGDEMAYFSFRLSDGSAVQAPARKGVMVQPKLTPSLGKL